MLKGWQEIKGAFDKGKKKLSEEYEKVKIAEQNIKVRQEQEKTEELRKEKIKENRRWRQKERRRLEREAINGRILLVVKSVCIVGISIWSCWIITDFVRDYDAWIAKYHKWSIEYESQSPARDEAKLNYENKIKKDIASTGYQKQTSKSNEYEGEGDFHHNKSEAKKARDISNTYNNFDINNSNFDVGRYCLEKEREGTVTFGECIGISAMKVLARE